MQLEAGLERTTRDKIKFEAGVAELNETLSRAQTAKIGVLDEIEGVRKENFSLRNELLEFKKQYSEQSALLNNAQKQLQTNSELQSECQNARNCYLSLEAA